MKYRISSKKSRGKLFHFSIKRGDYLREGDLLTEVTIISNYWILIFLQKRNQIIVLLYIIFYENNGKRVQHLCRPAPDCRTVPLQLLLIVLC